MALTFLGYQKTLNEDFKNLPFEKLLFFGTWCAEYLHTKYGSYLEELSFDEEAEIIQEAILFLWRSVDNPSGIDESEAQEHLENIQNIGIDSELDATETNDCGILELLSTVENTLTFIEKKEPKYIVGCAFFPLNVVDCIMTNELEIDTASPNVNIDHPLLTEEFSAQANVIDNLKINEGLTSADKHIFRS
jgi:hypothetical protein